MDRQYTRLDVVRELLDYAISSVTDEETKRCAYVHLYGVGLMASLLALKRGHDRRTAELAEIAGMLHDILTYVDPSTARNNHAHLSAEYAKKNILNRLGGFSDDEKQMIYEGIYNHSDKGIQGTAFDEIIKDADAAQHVLRNPMEDNFYLQERYQRVIRELIG